MSNFILTRQIPIRYIISMKKYFCLILCFVCVFSLFAQAKRSLYSKKTEENIIVYNENYEKGEELFALNKPDEAIPYFEKCIDDDGVNPNVWIHLGVAYYQTGDYARSLTCCTRGLAKENTDHKILAYNAGNSAYAMANYARAEACYAIAIKEDESFAPAYLNRANAQLRQDHLQDAKDNYIKYLSLESDSSQRTEIERLIALLDAEILRRANEKPERINPDLNNVRNDDVIAGPSPEKVDFDIPSQEIETEEDGELVHNEIATAPAMQKSSAENVVPEEKELSRVTPDAVPVQKEEEPLPSEIVPNDAQNPPEAEELVLGDREKADLANNDSDGAEQDESLPVESAEAFAQEELADALYSLPAGAVSVAPVSYGFSPNSPDSKNRKELFNVSATEPSKITGYVFEIIDAAGDTVRTMTGKKLPSRLEWDGLSDGGIMGDGRYTARITVEYSQGGSVTALSSAFSCFSEEPKVSIESQNQKFSPDGDGVDDNLALKVDVDSDAVVDDWIFEVKRNNQTIYSQSGKGNPPKEIEWDGKTSDGDIVKRGDSLEYLFSVTDSFGVRSQAKGGIEVSKSKADPVVVKSVEVNENDDGSVDIQIPTLSFRINSSELMENKSNNDTIQKVYEILVDEKYEDLKVLITGYVNPDGEKWTEDEKKLALDRALSVEQKLISLGVDKARMESRAGSGKSSNKEYNRRVEFKLIR